MPYAPRGSNRNRRRRRRRRRRDLSKWRGAELINDRDTFTV
jgi:hypothetical protein